MKQVYLLHVNERYKNLFLSQIRRVVVVGLVATVLGSLLAFGIGTILGYGSDSSLKRSPAQPTQKATASAMGSAAAHGDSVFNILTRPT
jgi:hypothetical protein